MIHCVVVDDEPLAIEILEDYLGRLKEPVSIKTFTDPVEAFSFLHQNAVDLLFIDLEMPLLNGLDIVRNTKSVSHIIITTAYREFAAEGFELDVCDYMVKPFSFPRFLKAISKTKLFHTAGDKQTDILPATEHKDTTDGLWIKVDKAILRISPHDIHYIESLKDYIRIVTTDQKLVTYQTLTSILGKLPAGEFVQVHKSYIVQLKRVKSIDGNFVMVKDESIPIGRSFRKELMDRVL
ncbi:LytR/AlgR family response regulator transcription factor [Chryseolinea lacunae]|uniref:Response regulator transcription factor n=1 Tax=Chryseolinea lacunae TaxID=2801331 RepID=A0ABS1KSE2_9BACT|nr:LytTR family DNA-binding domain-containing protein [Chryseolinea lacunae]MBL0742346.1 response regulator transcription factor [Chryseolinea lacunae]